MARTRIRYSILNKQGFTLTKDLDKKITLFVKQNMGEAINFAKQEDLDLFNYYDLFYAYNNKQFKCYLNSVSDGESYLDKIEVFATIDLVNKS